MQDEMSETKKIIAYDDSVNKSDILMKMNVGDLISFPINTVASIRAMCSTFGLMHNRSYRTRTNKENRTVEITRVS